MEEELQQAFDLIQEAVDKRQVSDRIAIDLVNVLNLRAQTEDLPVKFRLKTASEQVDEFVRVIKPNLSEQLDDESSELY